MIASTRTFTESSVSDTRSVCGLMWAYRRYLVLRRWVDHPESCGAMLSFAEKSAEDFLRKAGPAKVWPSQGLVHPWTMAKPEI